MDTNEIGIDMRKTRKPFRHFFNAFGYANTDFTYTPPSKRMYDHLSSFHKDFLYMRLHNILTSHGRGDYYLLNHGINYGNPPRDSSDTTGTDMVVSIDRNGDLCYDWTVVDRVYDIFMEHGIRPIVETYGMPSC